MGFLNNMGGLGNLEGDIGIAGELQGCLIVVPREANKTCILDVRPSLGFRVMRSRGSSGRFSYREGDHV